METCNRTQYYTSKAFFFIAISSLQALREFGANPAPRIRSPAPVDAVPNKALLVRSWCMPTSALASPGLGARGGRVVFSS